MSVLINCLNDNMATATNLGGSSEKNWNVEVVKWTLKILVNCLGAPQSSYLSVASGHYLSGVTTNGPPAVTKYVEDIRSKCCYAVRSSNGIMSLLNLLPAKAPITDADNIRYLV